MKKVNLDQTIEGKPEIEYPCEWTYKIIGTNAKSIRDLVDECLKKKKYSLSNSNKSSSGKYVSMSLKTIVADQAARDHVYSFLKDKTDIKMVM